eukprot:CAMPEP_0182454038 /NCGR_PEP_ID=MMETSP1319-20130603/842_1 /TAXON_ID=172717 /ORGANISM="Bolidomonas pacifica, Strain RCC208" /LENGTH=252 /DNA_ID=CAMNT_0024652007 /DNA_START=84 /DNA_END=842 /DNA_ORIENTATION=-
MSSFEDKGSEGGAWGPGSTSEAVSKPPATRPRLKLAPRTKPVGAAAAPASNSAIFGGARSREEILASKGIDLKKQEADLDKKAAVLKLTRDQEEEAEACRGELAYAEKELREANEQELPEGDLREKLEKKKKELSELLAKFSEINLKRDKEQEKEVKEKLKEGKPRFERPSERRRRQEEERMAKEGGGGGDGGGYGSPGRRGRSGSGGGSYGSYERNGNDDAFANFGGRNNRGGDRDRDRDRGGNDGQTRNW